MHELTSLLSFHRRLHLRSSRLFRTWSASAEELLLCSLDQGTFEVLKVVSLLKVEAVLLPRLTRHTTHSIHPTTSNFH